MLWKQAYLYYASLLSVHSYFLTVLTLYVRLKGDWEVVVPKNHKNFQNQKIDNIYIANLKNHLNLFWIIESKKATFNILESQLIKSAGI